MGIDLTDPRELDWLAQGRENGSPSFSDIHSLEDRDREIREDLIYAVGNELQSRDPKDRSRSTLDNVAENVISDISDEKRIKIEEKAWEQVSRTKPDPDELIDIYWQTLADRLVDYWDAEHRSSKSDRAGKRVRP